MRFVERRLMTPRLAATVVRLNLHDAAPVDAHAAAIPMPAGVVAAYGRTLRAALAMRGGVSLAVWIGGAVAELDVFRRIRLVRNSGEVEAYFAYTRNDEVNVEADEALFRRADIYAQVLESQGFDSIEFDILAGASAGGLNGVLYAAAQRAGASVDPMLDVWSDAGDIWRLIHPPGFRAVDSALQADGYFWPRVRTALTNLYASPTRNSEHVANRVSLDLSATITDGGDLNDGDSRQGYGHFHFVGADVGERGVIHDRLDGRRIPGDVVTPQDDDIARLAYAARTTSSFPGAFEPALIASHEVSAPSELDSDHLDVSYAFSAHRPRGASAFHVVDGGVKDNIPIDRAFRSIRQTPLDDFSTRALIYLNPRPDAPASIMQPQAMQQAPRISPLSEAKHLEARHDPLSHLVASTIAAVKKFAFRESGELEIQAVEDFRRDLLSVRGRSFIAAQAMRTSHDDFSQCARRAAIADYVQYRASADIVLLDEVLQHPALWELGTNLRLRRLRTSASERTRQLVEVFIISLYSEDLDPSGSVSMAITEGPQALDDTVGSASAWLRYLEETLFFSSKESHRDYAQDFAEIRDLIDRAASRARSARELLIDAVLQLVRGDDDETSAANIVNMWTTPAPALSDVWEGDLTDAVRLLKELTSALRTPALIELNIDHSIWSKIPLAPDFGAHDLAPLVSGSGIPEPMSDLRFRAISAGEAASSAIAFQRLREYREVTRARAAMRRPVVRSDPTTPSDPIGADSKLAGLTLFGFGGFLSTEWRRNDWWWGRLDAAAGMLRFLADLEPAPDTTSVLTPGDAVHIAQEELLRAATGMHQRSQSLNDVADAFASNSPSLASLRPDYLSAIASRLLRVVSRGITQPDEGLGVGRRLAVWVLRPLAVVAPAALSASKSVLMIGLAFAMLLALDPGGLASHHFDATRLLAWPGAVGGVIASVLVLAAAVSAVAAFRRGHARWRTVAPVAARERARGLRRFWTGVAIAVVAIAAVTIDISAGFLTALEFWALGAIVLVALGSAAHGAKSLPGPSTSRREVAISTFLAVGAIGLADWEARSHGWSLHLTVIVASAGTALAATLLFGWKVGLAPRTRPGETNWRRSLRVVLSFAVWLLLAAFCGGVAVLTVAASGLLPAGPLATLIAVLTTYVAWGTATWWVGEIRTPYEPKDDTLITQ
ncbi:DUF3376 domain-containing protein [Leifsonia sp. NPDC058292]|uniref:DUF3376 domain-containing protein n=1 Tax=Leifsonia sp. NPDC058292 TaxID=3346428 RepID=UPI0036DBD7E3